MIRLQTPRYNDSKLLRLLFTVSRRTERRPIHLSNTGNFNPSQRNNTTACVPRNKNIQPAEHCRSPLESAHADKPTRHVYDMFTRHAVHYEQSLRARVTTITSRLLYTRFVSTCIRSPSNKGGRRGTAQRVVALRRSAAPSFFGPPSTQDSGCPQQATPTHLDGPTPSCLLTSDSALLVVCYFSVGRSCCMVKLYSCRG